MLRSGLLICALAVALVAGSLSAADAPATPAAPAYAVPDKAKALAEVKALLAEAVKSGKKVTLQVNIAGWVKATLTSADEKGLTVTFEESPFTLKWEKIPAEDIPKILKSTLADNPKRDLVAMDYCLANAPEPEAGNLPQVNTWLDKTEEFMIAASVNRKELGEQLTVRSKALTEKHAAVKAVTNPPPVAAAGSVSTSKDGEVVIKAPAKIAFRPSEYGNLTPVKDVAAALDNAIEIGLADMGIQHEPVCDNYTFFRRAFLDITGQIPAPEDVNAFMAMGANRGKVIEELMKRPEYADRWANFWTVLLVGRRTREDADAKPHFFRSWMREQFARNERFDSIVTSVLTATGENDKNGPASYLTFHLSDTLPITVGHLSQSFLGARISCAQCHDHPFDKWTQQDFWGFSAFLANTRSERKELREDPKDPMKITRQWHVLIDSDTRNGGQRYDPPQAELRLPPKVLDGPVFQVAGSNNNNAGMKGREARRTEKKMEEKKPEPKKDLSVAEERKLAEEKKMAAEKKDDKKMASADEKKMGDDKKMMSDNKMGMADMMGMDDMGMMNAAAASGGAGQAGYQMRRAFAAWITSPKNERFAQSAVNRVWRDLFGTGLVEPVDDIRPKNPPVYPEVMKILAEDFNASGRDMQRMLAIIMNTKAYQRSSIGTLKNSDRVKQIRYFARAEVRPMTPESLFLAVIKSTAGSEKTKEVVEAMRKNDASYGYGASMMGMNADAGEFNSLLGKFVGTSTAEDRAGKLQFEGTVAQALYMMHNPFMQKYIKIGSDRYAGDVGWLFMTTLQRPPSGVETSAFGSMVSDGKAALWVLLNSSEFISIH